MNTLYIHSESVHNFSAPLEVVPVIMDICKPASVLDVGCGTGTWLKIFEQFQVHDYVGMDGSYVNRDQLKIPVDKFHPCDLRQYVSLGRKFDLVISLEVAEHLDERFADDFVRTLVTHGDLILFSAALPGQGGQHHLHERWLSYWVTKFENHNYTLCDVLRPLIWQNPRVDTWYKQNCVFFCKRDHRLWKELSQKSSGYVDIVHPDLFTINVQQAKRAVMYEEGKIGLKLLLRSLVRAIKNKLG